MIKASHYTDAEAYQTKDGSIIRELMHPGIHENTNQSLAEATVPPGVVTLLHKHGMTEELYFIISGTGLMTLEDEQFDVVKGDTICISPGTAHKIENNGTEPLVFLCCCAPAYSHDDTMLL